MSARTDAQMSTKEGTCPISPITPTPDTSMRSPRSSQRSSDDSAASEKRRARAAGLAAAFSTHDPRLRVARDAYQTAYYAATHQS